MHCENDRRIMDSEAFGGIDVFLTSRVQTVN